jgi:hypothetical protein
MFRSPKKDVATCFALVLVLILYFIHFIGFFYRFVLWRFWAIRKKGSSKTRKNFFFKKIHLGSSQKMWLFPPPFFPLPRLRFFGDKKKSRIFFSAAAKKSTYLSVILASLFF